MKSFALVGAKKVSPPRRAVLDFTDLLMEVRKLACALQIAAAQRRQQAAALQGPRLMLRFACSLARGHQFMPAPAPPAKGMRHWARRRSQNPEPTFARSLRAACRSPLQVRAMAKLIRGGPDWCAARRRFCRSRSRLRHKPPHEKKCKGKCHHLRAKIGIVIWRKQIYQFSG